MFKVSTTASTSSSVGSNLDSTFDVNLLPRSIFFSSWFYTSLVGRHKIFLQKLFLKAKPFLTCKASWFSFIKDGYVIFYLMDDG